MAKVKNLWPHLLGLIISLSFLLLFTSVPYLKSYVNDQIINLIEMDKCFRDGQIPCRWVPDLGGGYGYPLFNYSPPLPFYFGEAIYFLSNNFDFSIKAALIVGFLGSYVFMYYLLTYWRLKANLLSFIYVLLSLYIVTLSENSLGQIWQMMLLPLCFLNINVLSKKLNLRNTLVASLSFTLLILSANFIFISLAPISIWIIYRYLKRRSSNFLFLCLASVLLALMLSAFYLIPNLLEKSLVHKVYNFQYIPQSTNEIPKQEVLQKYQILTGDSDIFNFKQGSNWLKFATKTREHTIIRLSTYYFPNWKIFVDGKEVNFEYKNNSSGLMNLILGKGDHVVEARLYDTPIRSMSNAITLGAAFVTLLLFIIQFPLVRGWISYYRKRID